MNFFNIFLLSNRYLKGYWFRNLIVEKLALSLGSVIIAFAFWTTLWLAGFYSCYPFVITFRASVCLCHS